MQRAFGVRAVTSLFIASAALFSAAPVAAQQQLSPPILLAPGAEAPKSFQEALAAGWPSASNTGYPAGTQFTNTSGRTISTDNTVIDGQKITGGLVIAAKNVTVRNSWIISSFGTGEAVNGTGVIKLNPGASATIERCTLDGSNRTHAGIWDEGTSVVARSNNILGVNDGIFIWDADNFTLQDNYLHAFTTEASNGHIDGFQTEGASHGVIRHNTFDITQGQNAAVSVWDSRRNSDDIAIDGNLMAGGGFTVYVEDYSPSETSPAGGFSVTNVRITNNLFSNVHFPCVGNWGVWYTRGAPTDGWNRTGNTLIETGQSLDTKNPVVNGSECR